MPNIFTTSGTLPYDPKTDSIKLGSSTVNSQNIINGIANVVADANNQSQVPPDLPTNTIVIANPNELLYNVGMVKDNYFWYPSNHGNKFGDQSTIAPLSNIPTGVSSLNELWSKAGGHKGMIARHIFGGNVSVQAQLDQGQQNGSNYNVTGHRFAFQFHYNPTSISMTYDGASDVDPMFLMSNAKKFNPQAGAGMTQSSLSFSVLLNRKPDFKYYDSSGHLKPEAPRDLYAPRQPTLLEQEQIYAKGTMYDVGYLLGTLVGFSMPTQLRGDTTDIGFLIGAPIEVHLGRSLRYVGVISSIAVNHAFFDDRMVPTFTTVDIQMSRMPDYPGL